ncbi:taste receptor type 2 member 39 [Trichomycterus rosablanca]|uniref:taste receptor type 2 member 39 n=1 Tax=Trichomycterus rosablanca TaxID=2290929 RepID=UPI002F34F369
MLSIVDQIVIWLLTGFLAVLTIFFNVFILLVNQRNARKNHLHLCPGDTIMTGISFASIGHQVISYLWMTIVQVDVSCTYETVESILLVLIYSLKFCIMWMTAFLTFFFSTKLVIQPVHCYTHAQDVILKHVLTVVLVIYLFSFANCLPLLTVVKHQNSTSGTTDCGSITPADSSGLGYVIYLIISADIVPGVVMIKCSISISYHLAIHLQHMKESSNGAHTPKLGTQMRVIRMNLTLVAVFLCFLVVDLFTQSTVILKHENTMGLSVLFTTLYTTVSGFILVYGKKSFWKEFIHVYNLFSDEYFCLNSLKIPESKTPAHAPNTANAGHAAPKH